MPENSDKSGHDKRISWKVFNINGTNVLQNVITEFHTIQYIEMSFTIPDYGTWLIQTGSKGAEQRVTYITKLCSSHTKDMLDFWIKINFQCFKFILTQFRLKIWCNEHRFNIYVSIHVTMFVYNLDKYIYIYIFRNYTNHIIRETTTHQSYE